jgi:hypothetical protein
LSVKNKEAIYDAEIAPHMQAIIDICKREHIAMIASFDIPHDGEPDMVCTSIVPDESGNPERHVRANRAIEGDSDAAPMRIMTRAGNGAAIRDEIHLGSVLEEF